MAVELRHDGAVWTLEGHAAHPLSPVLVGGVAALVALLGAGSVGLAVGVVVLTVLVALVVAQTERRVVVEVSDRALTVTRLRWLGRDRTRLAIDEIEAAWVSPPREQGGSDSAVFRVDDTYVAVGPGRPDEELRWLVAAVRAAMEHHERRTRVEGREYRFMKKAPEGLASLVTHSRPEGPGISRNSPSQRPTPPSSSS